MAISFERRAEAFKAIYDKLVEILAALAHSNKTFKTAIIDHNTTNNEIVAAVEGKRIKVYAITLVVTGAVNAKWQSGSNDLSGDMNFGGKGEGYSDSVQPPAFLLATNAGEALKLALSAAVAVDGHIAYWDDDAT